MSKKKRILVISDSLALPRKNPEETLYEDTYPYMLKNDYEVLQLSYGGGTIKEIVHQAHYYLSFNPDYIILQSGIVDCAYRAFPLIVDKGALYSNFLNLYRRIIAKLIKPRRLRNFFKFRYTQPDEFQNNLSLLKKEFSSSKLIAIGIVNGSKEYEKVVPGISKSIDQYNELLKKYFPHGFIDLSEMGSECVMSDCHHINKQGHFYIYKKLVSVLKEE